MDSLEQMQLFVKAADAGSFSQAAREHNQAPSSVSRKMAALEEGLGVKLFVREGNLDGSFTQTNVAVPAPVGAALLWLGLLGLGVARRRRS